MRKAFTLIEVMVAVMIISIVIMAIIQMQGNGTHIFTKLDKQEKINQLSSFLISNPNDGFETKHKTFDKLGFDFKLDSDLRKELKRTKIKLSYEELKSIDISDREVFEIGKTTIKTENSSAFLIRVRLQ